MRFGAQRTEGHGLRAEASEDRVQRLDFIERNRLLRQHLQQVAQEGRAFGLGELLKGVVVALLRLANVRVHAANKLRRSGVKFGAFAEAVQAVVRRDRPLLRHKPRRACADNPAAADRRVFVPG